MLPTTLHMILPEHAKITYTDHWWTNDPLVSFGRNGQRVTKWTPSIHFIGIIYFIPIFTDSVADVRVSKGDIHADGV